MKSENKGYYKQFLLGILVIAIVLSNFIPNGNSQKFTNAGNLNMFTVQATRDYVEEEITITWENKQIIETEFLYTNGKIFVNFTNLLSSPSSVNFTRPEYDSEYIEWSPEWPLSFILVPGESYSNTFTLKQAFDVANNMEYLCKVLTEGSNATIRWGYQIIKSGNKLPANGILQTLFPIAIIVFITQLKKKRTDKK